MNKYLLGVFIFLVSSAAYAQNGAPAREPSCRACHGAGGAVPIVPNYPKINGQNKAYLVSALKAYRSGERKGGLAAAMAAQATRLSDADIEELASYYASQK